MKLNDYWRGAVLALAAATCWGMISPVAKVLAAAGIDLMTVMTFRSMFTVIASGIFLLFTEGRDIFCFNAEYMRFYVISGILSVAFAGGGFLMSLAYLSVPEALVIHYTFPIVTIIGSLYITHENPTIFQYVAGGIIVCGVFIGMGGSMDAMLNISLPGLLWGILAVFGISVQALVVRSFSLVHKVNEFRLLFFSNIFGCILLLVFKTFQYGWGDLANLTMPLFSLMTLQAFTGSFVAYGLFYSALKYIPAAMGTLLCTMEMVVAVILTTIFVHQIPSVHEVVGCALILVAIACTAVPARHK